MNVEVIELLQNIVGENWVTKNREDLIDYLIDETAFAVRPKAAEDIILIKPITTQEISRILELAEKWKIPVFPRGGGTGLVGGCIPTKNGILLSLERMNRIVEVDRENQMIIVEAGVTLRKLVMAAEEAGLSFPLHPGDEMAQVGGLIACNAGGARAVKHGVMRSYVKGIEVVLPTGDVLDLGGKLLKDASGYNLIHLIIGSQGTLGIITKAVLRLYPRFNETATLIIPYNDQRDAIMTAPRILRNGIIPLAIEYVERTLMEKSAKQIGKLWPVKNGKTCLIVIVTGDSRENVYSTADKIDQIAKKQNALTTLVVQSKSKQNDILAIRSKIYSFLKPITLDITDVAVPPSNMVKFTDALDKIAEKFSTNLPTFGHIGDGNLHTHILMKKDGGVDEMQLGKIKHEIYEACVNLGGTITAEHGVGKIRIKNLQEFSNKKRIELMKKIKEVFDPYEILNPGTLFTK